MNYCMRQNPVNIFTFIDNRGKINANRTTCIYIYCIKNKTVSSLSLQVCSIRLLFLSKRWHWKLYKYNHHIITLKPGHLFEEMLSFFYWFNMKYKLRARSCWNGVSFEGCWREHFMMSKGAVFSWWYGDIFLFLIHVIWFISIDKSVTNQR